MQQFLTAAAFICLVGGFCNCTTPRQLTARAAKDLLADTALRQAHIGISLYDPATGRYLYNHQGDKYFIPASNIKLFTCYVGMKYLGDSLLGLQYWQNDTAIWLLPTGDPTLLHPDFERHPVLEFLQRQTKSLYLLPGNWRTNALGHGWAWDDYSSEYMVERSPLPVHGNMAVYQWRNTYPSAQGKGQRTWRIQPDYFTTQLDTTGVQESTAGIFDLQRQRMGNRVGATWRADSFDRAEIPVYTDTINTALAVLRYRYLPQIQKGDHSVYLSLPQNVPPTGLLPLKSQPTDSMLRPMMHRSDNFYAEQTLLMVSHERLGRMNEMALIDTLLKTDLVDLPQRPKWVDGSGLSRYNLATPQSLVQLLQKMSREFGLERLKTILPTGGKGTIGRYYQNLQGRIFAKTGTLSNNCALSGYLHTKSGKWLIFSVLANHYPAGATPVRRAVERFLNKVWQQY